MSGEAVMATKKATVGTERAGGATQGADTGDGRTIDFSIRNTLADISASYES